MFQNYWRAYFPWISSGWTLTSISTGLFIFGLLQWYETKRPAKAGTEEDITNNGSANLKRALFSLAGGFSTGYMEAVFAMLVADRSPGVRRAYWMPFWSYGKILEGNKDLFFENLFNIFLFVPLGAALMVWMTRDLSRKAAFWQAVLGGVCFSVAIELLQLWTTTGLAEFDDIFHNTLGTAAGAGIALVVIKATAGSRP